MNVFVAVALVGIAFVAVSAARNRVLGRIGLRNVVRRRGSTPLVVLGSMIGTAMIAGSLVVGDSFERTAHHEVFRRLGEIDHVVTFSREGQAAYFPREGALERGDTAALNAITRDLHGEELVDGVLPVVQELAPVALLDETGEAALFRPQVAVTGFDPTVAATFGEDPPSLPAFSPGEVLVARSFADELPLVAGDAVEVRTHGQATTFTVAAVVPDDGLTGYRPIRWDMPGITGPVLAHLPDVQAMFADGDDRVNALLVSNVGGVLTGGERNAEVGEAIVAALGGLVPGGQLRAEPVKEWLLEGSGFIGIAFAIFSAFAIAAGIMLLVTIYGMLAEERRTEMGTLRAVSARRGHLVRLYTYEGLVYSLIAAVVGVAAGVGIAAGGIWALVRGARGTWILPEGFALSLVVRPTTLLVAATIGLLIAMGTVVATSVRFSRLNIVAAIRDLPDPPRQRRRLAGFVAPALLLLIGAVTTLGAVRSDEAHLYLIGPIVLALGVGMSLRHVLPTRVVMTPVLLGVAAYSQLALGIPAVNAALDESPAILILTGLLLVAASIGVVALNLSAVLWLVGRLQSRMRRLLPVLRVAIAYPAERPGRTGLVLGMFAIVVYVVTLVATVGAPPRHHVEGISETMVGGFDAVITTVGGNTLDAGRLAESPPVRDGRVATIGAVHTYEVELPAHRLADHVRQSEVGLVDPDAAFRSAVSAIEPGLLRENAARLSVRAEGYANDAEAWAALAEDPSLVIADYRYSGLASWDPRPELAVGETISVRDPATGEIRQKTVIGRTADEPVEGPMRGLMMSSAAIEELNPGAVALPPIAYLARFAEGTAARGAALDLERDLVGHGAQVMVVAEEVAMQVGGLLAFMRIWQGFLALGLVVGIIGLAVVSARNVHRRHHEIGTLRALGFQRGRVTGVFLAESTIVAGIGVLLGVATGVVSGYFLGREMWSTADLSFVLPAGEIALLAGSVLLASLVFTALPARRAAALSPVEALRARE
jgi:putative ABC transport system permease protein